MKNKERPVILIAVLVIAILAIFALASAAVNNRAYLPVVMNVTGTPPAARPPVATPIVTPVSRHFDDCAFRTGSNATIAVPVDTTIRGDLVLAVDDEIAVFTPDGTVCAGLETWSGKNIAITAWGDDSQTEEVDGLRDGEEILYRIWDKSEGEEITVKRVEYTLGDGTYVTDGIVAVKSFILE